MVALLEPEPRTRPSIAVVPPPVNAIEVLSRLLILTSEIVGGLDVLCRELALSDMDASPLIQDSPAGFGILT
jgi:hypothetical protein